MFPVRIIRIAVTVLVMVAIVSLVSSGVAGLAAGLSALGALVIIPILFFKLAFVLMIFGFFGRKAGRPWRGGTWRRPDAGSTDRTPSRSREDDFEEWHRMAHAREEVDSWVPEV